MHPSYSPDFAPSNYHLFRALQNSLNGVKLISKKTCENHLSVFRPEITEVLHGIMVLPQKWQKVVKQNGTFGLINFI